MPDYFNKLREMHQTTSVVWAVLGTGDNFASDVVSGLPAEAKPGEDWWPD
jgi:hypothetical protein